MVSSTKIGMLIWKDLHQPTSGFEDLSEANCVLMAKLENLGTEQQTSGVSHKDETFPYLFLIF